MRIWMQGDDGIFLAELEINRVDSSLPDEETGDYQVRYKVWRGGVMLGAHQRGLMRFPRKQYNALGLLKRALALLDDKELELEDGAAPCDMVRGFSRTRKALPGQEEDPLGNY